MFHNRDSSGIELGKPFLKSAMRWCYQVPQIPGSVIVVDRKMALPTRRTVQRVLGIVNKELGSVDIKEDELWSQRVPEGEKDEESGGKKADRFKAFMHIIDDKCVGICLAERITKAHRVLPGETATSETLPLNGHFGLNRPASPAPTDSHEEEQTKLSHRPQIPTPVASPTSSSPPSSISISEETYPAVVGVSRIWTSKAFRHKGIANNLLDCALNQFIYGMELAPQHIAFSQPTESGAALARSWFGESDGWAVYRED
jgi:N-acetyltransferase